MDKRIYMVKKLVISQANLTLSLALYASMFVYILIKVVRFSIYVLAEKISVHTLDNMLLGSVDTIISLALFLLGWFCYKHYSKKTAIIMLQLDENRMKQYEAIFSTIIKENMSNLCLYEDSPKSI